jgi:heptaprenyl diphosphate synthase
MSMQSRSSVDDTGTDRLVRIALFGAIGAALAVVESMFPRPVPWVRLGLGHAAVLVVLWVDGVLPAFAVMAIKLVVSGLISGSIAQPTMIVAVFAGVASLGGMSLTTRLGSRTFIGPVGVSVVGALTYGIAQLGLVGVWLVKSPIWVLSPLILAPAVVAGFATGVLSAFVLRRMGKWQR